MILQGSPLLAESAASNWHLTCKQMTDLIAGVRLSNFDMLIQPNQTALGKHTDLLHRLSPVAWCLKTRSYLPVLIIHAGISVVCFVWSDSGRNCILGTPELRVVSWRVLLPRSAVALRHPRFCRFPKFWMTLVTRQWVKSQCFELKLSTYRHTASWQLRKS